MFLILQCLIHYQTTRKHTNDAKFKKNMRIGKYQVLTWLNCLYIGLFFFMLQISIHSFNCTSLNDGSIFSLKSKRQWQTTIHSHWPIIWDRFKLISNIGQSGQCGYDWCQPPLNQCQHWPMCRHYFMNTEELVTESSTVPDCLGVYGHISSHSHNT